MYDARLMSKLISLMLSLRRLCGRNKIFLPFGKMKFIKFQTQGANASRTMFLEFRLYIKTDTNWKLRIIFYDKSFVVHLLI